MTQGRPRTLIATVTYNSADALQGFLASLGAACRYPCTVSVADNASDDADTSRALANAAGARFVTLGENRGYGAGIAAAIDAAADVPWDYVLIANPDVVFGRGAVDTMVAAAEKDSKIGAVGPKVLDATGAVYPSARSVPSIRSGIGHALFARVWPRNPWTREYHVEKSGGEARDAGWLSGACLLLRRAVYEQTSGFDPRFFMYFEDVDLGKRIGELGWRQRYVPAAEVTHVGAHSTSRHAAKMLATHHRSAYLYLAKHYSSWYWWPFRALTRAGLAVRAWWMTRR